ncbi:MAG: beta-ketoacyl reductase, partial [Myxococcota bacterium]
RDAPLAAHSLALSAGAPSLIVLADPRPTLAGAVAERFPTSELLSLGTRDPDSPDLDVSIVERFTRDALELFESIRSRLATSPRSPESILVVVLDDEQAPFAHLPLLALLKTAYLENPMIRGRLLRLPPAISISRALEILAREPALAPVPGSEPGLGHGGGRIASRPPEEIRHLDSGERQRRCLREVADDALVGAPGSSRQRSSIEPGGVYWITGGMGRLGQIFARHIASFPDTTIILSGRSQPDETGRAELEALHRQPDTTVEHCVGDASSLSDMRRIAETILTRHGRLNGVIHAAGVLRDGYLLHKCADDIRAVLAPKVDGVVNLDLATRATSLDFFAVLSSFTSLLGNPGQADYATANAFLDGYADYRQRLVQQGARTGKTIAINWPLWRNGGMGQSDKVREQLRHQLGMEPMGTAMGLDIFERALRCPEPQLLVIAGDRAEIRQRVLNTPETETHRREPAQPARESSATHDIHDDATLRARVVVALKQLLERVTKIPESKIDDTEPFEMYGVDSIIIGQINRVLDEVLGDNLVSKTLLYEYRTIAELADYLVDEQRSASLRWVAQPDTADTPNDDPPDRVGSDAARDHMATPRSPATGHQRASAIDASLPGGRSCPIAIIGLAGR